MQPTFFSCVLNRPPSKCSSQWRTFTPWDRTVLWLQSIYNHNNYYGNGHPPIRTCPWSPFCNNALVLESWGSQEVQGAEAGVWGSGSSYLPTSSSIFILTPDTATISAEYPLWPDPSEYRCQEKGSGLLPGFDILLSQGHHPCKRCHWVESPLERKFTLYGGRRGSKIILGS